jgi:thioredoxin reductase (NADPH)
MKKLLILMIAATCALPQLKAEEPPPQVEPSIYPVIVLGSGVGALTAAMYLGRAGIKHVVIEGSEPGGALAKSHSVQNWPGELEISGAVLTEKMHQQAEQSGSVFLNEELIGVDFSTHPYTFTTRDVFDKERTHAIRASSAIIAMGSKANWLGIPGEEKYFSRGVYTCALCDGPLYKNKTVAIVGGGDSAVTEAHYLARIAKQVYVFVRKDAFRGTEEKRRNEVLANPNIKVFYNAQIKEVKGNDNSVTHLVYKQKGKSASQTIPVDALFLAIGSSPNTKLFESTMELNKSGYVLLKKGQETSLAGVFAIGDITEGLCKQAICAAGDGAYATMQVEQYLATVPQSEPIAQECLVTENVEIAYEVVEITSQEQFDEAIKDSSVAVYVDFYAPWCGPCKQLHPKFEKLAQKLSGTAKFLKVNVDTQSELADKYKIQSLPTVLLFNNNGDVIDRKIGTDEISKSLNIP